MSSLLRYQPTSLHGHWVEAGEEYIHIIPPTCHRWRCRGGTLAELRWSLYMSLYVTRASRGAWGGLYLYVVLSTPSLTLPLRRLLCAVACAHDSTIERLFVRSLNLSV